jgi:chemotaxis protein methyltransferase CheR
MNDLQFLLDRVRENKGVDFSLYRQNTISRRVGSRLRKTGCADYLEYVAYLERSPEEYDRFLQEVTINVTEFFRNPETFAAIVEKVLPKLDFSRPLRVWCAGTSFGEEAYSMAILFQEAFGNNAAERKVAIMGTDIDPLCVEKARAGLYEPSQLKEVDSYFLEKYFLQEGELYRVKDEIKQRVEFKAHNFISELPFENVDLLLCRNVMIYFTRGLQEAVYSLFLEGLNSGGFLVLGKVETVWGVAKDRFETIDNYERIYRKI